MLPSIADVSEDAWRDGGGRGKKAIVKQQFNILLPFPPISQENLNGKGKDGGRTYDSE